MSAPLRGSGAFADVTRNRNGLEPRPSRTPDAACVYADVTARGGESAFAGERGHPVFPVRLPSTSVSMSIGELAPGAATSNHRHAYESLVYVIAGAGYTIMEGQRYEWKAGDAFYTPPWCWHQHVASSAGPVQYLTSTNMPLLEAIGQTVLREEESKEGTR